VRVLLLSAYDAASHRFWHQQLRGGLADWDWQLLDLPPRHFAWRVRGNPLQWALQERDLLARPWDLVLATSMVDLATLRGLVPALAHVPAILYFHENQFCYPEGRAAHGLLEAQMVSLYSALAADRLLFNSAYNRDTFLAGVSALLRRLPDAVPAGIPARLASAAEVLPVPVDTRPRSPIGAETDRLQLVWNHRWEHDKGPGELLAIVEALLGFDAGFTVHVIGQQFREQPPEFSRLRELLEKSGSLGRWGYVDDREAYLCLLASCDVVLSTAQHDFQGLSVLEACAQGCTPLVPDRLVYPEWFDASFRYGDAAAAAQRIAEYAALRTAGRALPRADVSSFSTEILLPAYRSVLRSQAERNSVS